ncbi:MAG TPA: CBS domain-containing protein [Acidimicrobiia bacterium]|nr:CBS domain-containing protein [Acidimicrobiia bacterium]
MIVEELIGGEVGTCSPDTTLKDAAAQMVESDVGSLVVMDNGKLAGIVTERDLVRSMAEGVRADRTAVEAVMTPRPDSIAPDVEVEEAAQWMMAAGYRHMPVMTNDRLVGVVSIKDLLWAISESRLPSTEM